MTDLDLTPFTGTEAYYRWSVLFPKIVLTDGTKYLADEAGAFWLMDCIGSHLPSVPKTESYAIATLEKTKKNWKFALLDDIPPTKVYAKQTIGFSDFPLDEIKLYVIRQDDLWVIMLCSEY